MTQGRCPCTTFIRLVPFVSHTHTHTPLRRLIHSAATWTAATVLLTSGGTALAQDCPVEGEATLLTAGTVAGGRLGASLAVSPDGTRAAAGRPGPEGGSPLAGAVITYTFDPVTASWVEDAGVVTDDIAQLGDRFGASVAMAGDYMAVGAPGRLVGVDAAAGSVSIFRWDPEGGEEDEGAWEHVSRITQPSGAQLEARFGESVDLQYEPGIGWTLIVGAPGARLIPGLPDVFGRAFVLTSPGTPDATTPWIEVADLSDGTSPGAFGSSVAISGPYAIIGDPVQNGFQGGAFVYERLTPTSWSTSPAASFSGADIGAEAGTSVDIDGTTAVIGVPFAEETCPPGQGGSTPGVPQGAVTVMERSGGSWLPTLTFYDDACVDGGTFGSAVAIVGDRIAVGTPATGSATPSDAAITTFQRTPNGFWFRAGELTAEPVGTSPVGFGAAVAVIPNLVGDRSAFLAGWPTADSIAPAEGSVMEHVDTVPASVLDCNSNGIPDDCELGVDPAGYDCNANGIIDSCDIASGFSTDCNSNATPDDCEGGDPAFSDCDGDGNFDACEIASGAEEDCNGNGIPDSCELYTAEIVFIIDASGSQEGKGSLICETTIGAVLQGGILGELDSRGVNVRAEILAIDICGSGNLNALACVDDSDTVYAQYGTGLPGPRTDLWPSTSAVGCESWSAASAIIADRYPWQTKLRIVVPISDECAWLGGSSNCDSNDHDSVEAALAALACRDVMAMPIQFANEDGEYSSAVAELMTRLAIGGPSDVPPTAGTGGQFFSSESSDLIIQFADAVEARLAIHDDNDEAAEFAGPELDACAFELDLFAGGGIADRNRNGISDRFELVFGMSIESNAFPGVPAEVIPSQCGPADIDGDSLIGFEDVLQVLADWGCQSPSPCAGDVDDDGSTGFSDLLAVLGAWGYCHEPAPCGDGPSPIPPPSPGPPSSIADCIQKYGSDPVKLQRCIEAMILAQTP